MGCGESKHAVVENTLTKSMSRTKKPVEEDTADVALLKEEIKREKVEEGEKVEVVEERKDEIKKEEGKGNEGKVIYFGEEDLKADESKELASNEETKPSAEEKTVSDPKEEAIAAAPVVDEKSN